MHAVFQGFVWGGETQTPLNGALPCTIQLPPILSLFCFAPPPPPVILSEINPAAFSSTHSFCYLVAIHSCCAKNGITPTQIGTSVEEKSIAFSGTVIKPACTMAWNQDLPTHHTHCCGEVSRIGRTSPV